MKIALSMIVKGTGDEPKKLKRALESVIPFVDKAFVTITGPKKDTKEAEEVCTSMGVEVSRTRALTVTTPEMVEWLTTFFGYEPHMKAGDKVFTFDVARNFNFEQISQEEYPWIFWMDCDDVLLRGENLRTLAEGAKENGIEAFYFNYIYQAEFDKDGNIVNILIQHLRERLVRNMGVYKWIAPIHETLIEQRPTRKADSPGCEVLHLAVDEDRQFSLQRNLKNLELSVYQTEGKDPRPIYYLAKAFFDLRTPEYTEKAIGLIFQYLNGENPSGWPEERAQAWEYLAELYRRKAEHNNSLKACMNALIESPENPSVFINIALSYVQKQEWDRALFWVKLASAVPQRKTTLVNNPKDVQARTLEIIYNASLNLNQIDNAWAAMLKLAEMFPDDVGVANGYRAMLQLRTERDLNKEIVHLANFLRDSGEVHKIKPLLQALPASIQDSPFMINLYQQNNPSSYHEKNHVAIYCGPGFTNWSPKRMVDPQGSFVGGSEEAVILVSEALVKQGWKVTVYGDPGQDEGEINGVEWLPYYKFNRLDHFNILIGWRDIRFFDSDFKAKKKYLWCHDIQNPVEYTKERIDRINKVFFLSQWHRENVKDLPDEKVLLTSNGIPV